MTKTKATHVVIYDHGINPNTSNTNDEIGAVLTSEEAARTIAARCDWAFVQSIPDGYKPCTFCNTFVPDAHFGAVSCKRCEAIQKDKPPTFVPDDSWKISFYKGALVGYKLLEDGARH